VIDITNNADDLRAYLAAELHCAATEHKLAAADFGGGAVGARWRTDQSSAGDRPRRGDGQVQVSRSAPRRMRT
jgi:hypothetical protein